MTHYVSLKITECTPEQKDGVDGFRVTYQDGYVSWCPATTHERDFVALGWLHHCDPIQRRTMAFSVIYEERLKELRQLLADTEIELNIVDRRTLNNELFVLENFVEKNNADVGGMLRRLAREEED